MLYFVIKIYEDNINKCKYIINVSSSNKNLTNNKTKYQQNFLETVIEQFE